MPDDVTRARKGDFLVLGVLGAGGMGRVYKVRNVLSDRVEAMKILLPDLSDQKDLVGRFLLEIKVLAALHHPNIAELRTALTIDNQLVMIMEFVEGSTLASHILQGPLRCSDALACFDQIVAALSYAHAKKIIHRDIKPANIMLTSGGFVKLMDFGIARSGNDLGLTMTGTTLGSIGYMSPEQIRCEPIDGRSDLYSVGVSLYESVTGRRPYIGENNFEIMQAHLHVAPTPPVDLNPGIPPKLNHLILKAMAKDPESRFQTAEELQAALKQAIFAPAEATLILTSTHSAKVDVTTPATPSPHPRVPPGPVSLHPAAAETHPPSKLPDTPTIQPLETSLPARAHPKRQGVIAAIAVTSFVVLCAASFAVPHFVRPRSFARPVGEPSAPVVPNVSATTKASSSAGTDPGTLKADPCASGEVRCGERKPDKSTQAAAMNSPVRRTDERMDVGEPSMKQAPADKTDARAREEAERANADSVAQFVALEREELDDLSVRSGKLNARAVALQRQEGGELPREIVASQQLAQSELARAQESLQSADVQNAQKYMEEASSELDKLQKFLGP